MITTADDVFSRTFPHADEWMRAALAHLTTDPLLTEVGCFSPGEVRQPDGTGLRSLLALSEEYLWAAAETGPLWRVELRDIAAVDALTPVGEDPVVLEMERRDGSAAVVRVPEAFCERFVVALEAAVARCIEPPEPAPADEPVTDGVVTAPEPTAPEVVDDPWAGIDPPALDDELRHLDLHDERLGPDLDDDAYRATPEQARANVAQAFEEHDDEHLGEVAAEFFGADTSAPEADEPAPSAPGTARRVPRLSEWPEPVAGAAYTGGHPNHPKRRKHVMLRWSEVGMVASADGLNPWHVLLEWADIAGMDVQSPDELRFRSGIRIDQNSTALVVALTIGGEMAFEVRMRRPAAVRASLAPILNEIGRGGIA